MQGKKLGFHAVIPKLSVPPEESDAWIACPGCPDLDSDSCSLAVTVGCSGEGACPLPQWLSSSQGHWAEKA